MKCVFVWNGKHKPSTELLLMGGSSWVCCTVGWRSRAVGGGCSGEAFPKVVGSCGDVADPLRSCQCCRLWSPFPSPCTALGHPRAACVVCGAARFLCCLGARGHLCAQPCFSSCWISTQKCVQCDLSLQLPSGWLCRAGLWGFSFPHYLE